MERQRRLCRSSEESECTIFMNEQNNTTCNARKNTSYYYCYSDQNFENAIPQILEKVDDINRLHEMRANDMNFQ
jgi:hypothetical protein